MHRKGVNNTVEGKSVAFSQSESASADIKTLLQQNPCSFQLPVPTGKVPLLLLCPHHSGALSVAAVHPSVCLSQT